LSKFFNWHSVRDPMTNPLYAATERVTDKLLQCPDMITNQTQLPPLLIYSDDPFLEMKVRQIQPLERQREAKVHKMISTLIRQMPDQTPVLFHVFQGGKRANQLEPFQKAMRKLNSFSSFEIHVRFIEVAVSLLF
jgi:hypothetical protein